MTSILLCDAGVARGRFYGGSYGRKFKRFRRKRDFAVSRDITYASACFDLQAGPRGQSMLASAFSIPTNCAVKIYGAVVWIACEKNCAPGVLRVQVGGGSDKSDVAITGLTCVTAGVVRRIWVRMPSHTDYHVFSPNLPVISFAHGTDCGGGGGKLQVSVTLYWLRQPDMLL